MAKPGPDPRQRPMPTPRPRPPGSPGSPEPPASSAVLAASRSPAASGAGESQGSPRPAPTPRPKAPGGGSAAASASATAGAASGGGAPSGGGGKATPRARPATRPGRRDRWTAWLVLAALVCVSLVPLLIDLARAPVVDHDEARALKAAVTRRRLAADSDAWLVPMPPGESGLGASGDASGPARPGTAQLSAPPLVPWLQARAMAGLPLAAGAKASPARLRGRLVSVAFALLTLAAVVWLGFSIGGLVTASFSGLALLGMPAFLLYGRLATAAMPAAAWTALAAAAALWAMRPFRPSPGFSRQAIGWLIAGGALALAMLSAGPAMLVPVLVPLAALGAICPRQISNLLGLLAMVCVGALMLTPWVLLVTDHDPAVWGRWASAVWPGLLAMGGWEGYLRTLGLRVALLLALVLPWMPWVIAGILQPLSTSSKGVRTRMFLGWAWFVSVVVVVVIDPRPGAWEGLVLTLAPAGLVVGQLFRQYADLSAEGRHARSWRIGSWPMAMALLGLSLVIPALAYSQRVLIDAGMLAGPAAHRLMAAMGWPYWAGVGAALIALSMLAVRYAANNRPGKAMACWAMWTLAATTVVIVPVVRGPLMRGAPRVAPPSAPPPAAAPAP